VKYADLSSLIAKCKNNAEVFKSFDGLCREGGGITGYYMLSQVFNTLHHTETIVISDGYLIYSTLTDTSNWKSRSPSGKKESYQIQKYGDFKADKVNEEIEYTTHFFLIYRDEKKSATKSAIEKALNDSYPVAYMQNLVSEVGSMKARDKIEYNEVEVAVFWKVFKDHPYYGNCLYLDSVCNRDTIEYYGWGKYLMMRAVFFSYENGIKKMVLMVLTDARARNLYELGFKMTRVSQMDELTHDGSPSELKKEIEKEERKDSIQTYDVYSVDITPQYIEYIARIMLAEPIIKQDFI
jgi:hypothetical protein